MPRASLSEGLTTMSKLTPLQATAPRKIWLQISDDADHHTEPFPEDWHHNDSITWCADSVTACQVGYVREDLAAVPAGAEPVAEVFTDAIAGSRVAMYSPLPDRTKLYAAPTAQPQPERMVLFDDRPQNQRIAEAEARMRNPAPLQFEDECAANMNGHWFGSHGPNGEQQCQWCGEQPERLPYVSALDPAMQAINVQPEPSWPTLAKSSGAAHQERKTARLIEQGRELQRSPEFLRDMIEAEDACGGVFAAGGGAAQPEAPAEPSYRANQLVALADTLKRDGVLYEKSGGAERALRAAAQELHEALAAPVARQPAELTDEASRVRAVAENIRRRGGQAWESTAECLEKIAADWDALAIPAQVAELTDAQIDDLSCEWVYIRAGTESEQYAELRRLVRAAIKAQGGSQ
jgi:hypothetical protein